MQSVIALCRRAKPDRVVSRTAFRHPAGERLPALPGVRVGAEQRHREVGERLADVVQQRRHQHPVGPAVAAGVDLLRRGAARQHQAAAALQRNRGAFQRVRKQSARLGVVMGFGRRQALHEFGVAVEQRRAGPAPVRAIESRQLGDLFEVRTRADLGVQLGRGEDAQLPAAWRVNGPRRRARRPPPQAAIRDQRRSQPDSAAPEPEQDARRAHPLEFGEQPRCDLGGARKFVLPLPRHRSCAIEVGAKRLGQRVPARRVTRAAGNAPGKEVEPRQRLSQLGVGRRGSECGQALVHLMGREFLRRREHTFDAVIARQPAVQDGEPVAPAPAGEPVCGSVQGIVESAKRLCRRKDQEPLRGLKSFVFPECGLKSRARPS